MAVSAVTAGSSTAVPQLGSTALSGDVFLRLLVAQLRNQDPMNPVDSQAFTTQLVQMQTLEQLQAIADGVRASQEMDAVSQSLSLLGHHVEYTAPDSSSGEDTTPTTLTGLVESVRLDKGMPMLIVDGKEVQPGAVVAILTV